ncbi:hypothetical protein AAD018_017885 [Aestuariibius insulae]|uniref:hypothetical protein n=1 Tax=Aestuariibius insulae TaxID=2058287 RepID=UPI00345EB47E
MKIATIAALFVLGIMAAYVLHVPALNLVSGMRLSAEERTYPSLSQGPQSENYEIAQLVYGWSEIWFDQQDSSYLIVADPVEPWEPGYFGRFVLSVSQDGHLIERRRLTSSVQFLDLENDARYVHLHIVPERQYTPAYSFEQLSGRLDLVGFEFTEFDEWPYLYYFIPVISFDWMGIGYYRLTHRGEQISFRQPTEFHGGFLYSMRNVDGQLYLTTRGNEPSDVVFLTVDETSYSRSMDGRETHRDAYGLHVIRARPD